MQYAVFRLGVDPVRQSNSTQFTFLLWKNFESFIHTHTNTRTHTSWSIARDISNRPSIFCLWQTKQKKISGIPLVDGESTTTPPTNLSSINNRICGSWKLAEGLATKYMNKVYVAQPIVESIEIYCGGILLGSYIYIYVTCLCWWWQWRVQWEIDCTYCRGRMSIGYEGRRWTGCYCCCCCFSSAIHMKEYMFVEDAGTSELRSIFSPHSFASSSRARQLSVSRHWCSLTYPSWYISYYLIYVRVVS